MIIDAILDRKACPQYYGKEEIKYILEEADIFGFNEIIRAFASKEEKFVQDALCNYIDNNGYNPAIKDYIRSVNWLEEV